MMPSSSAEFSFFSGPPVLKEIKKAWRSNPESAMASTDEMTYEERNSVSLALGTEDL